jgi:FkbM family methyltransferase
MAIPPIRSLMWRAGRKFYCAARREYANDPRTNGEYWLLEQVLSTARDASPVLIDVGANRGDWTHHARAFMRENNVNGRIWAFEPAQSTFDYLRGRFTNDSAVQAQRVVISKQVGETDFYTIAPYAGTNSRLEVAGSMHEIIKTLSVDAFLIEQQLSHVAMVKSDVEGFEMDVLYGAETALTNGLIDVWTFEYNHRWIHSRHFLKDVYDFIASKPYRIGKLYGNGIEFHDSWHPELERFFETNFVLIRRESSHERLGAPVSFDVSNAARSVSGKSWPISFVRGDLPYAGTWSGACGLEISHVPTSG